MRSFFKTVLLPATICAAFAAMTFFGCTAEVDDTLGMGLLPDDQQMYFGTHQVEGINSYLAFPDSIVTSRLGRLIFGKMEGERLGRVTAGTMFQFVPAESNSSMTNPYGYKPVADSVDLILQIEKIFGDTSVEQKFYVYRFDPTVAVNPDSLYYADYDIDAAIDRNSPLFSFKMKDEVIGAVYKNFDIEEAGREFLKELVSLDTLVYTNQTDSDFRELFQGLYIAPSTDPAEAPENGAIYHISPLTYTYYGTVNDYTFLIVYAHNHKKEPELGDITHICGDEELVIQDTVYVTYSLDDSSDLAVYSGTTIVTVDHDYTGTIVDESKFIDPNNFSLATAPQSDPIMVQGLLGVASYLYFTDDFLDTLQELKWFRDEQGNKTEEGALVVNKALLRIYIDDPDNVELLNVAPQRLGMYYEYSGVNPLNIPDYMYLYESYYTIAYGGNINRALGCYEMDISMYIRGLANSPDDTRKGVWLAPAVPTQFYPDEVVLENYSPELGKNMQVSLYYTLVKKK